LWTGNYRRLAQRFVRLDGEARSDDDVMSMLEARVQPVRGGFSDAAAVEE